MLIGFLPLFLFVGLYVGSGIYFSFSGVPQAFYQLPATIALLPAIALGWCLDKGSSQERTQRFLNGVRHPDIITMCLVFLLAGAFSTVTKAIGSVDATVHLALSLIPSPFLLGGLFLTAAFISTAIGTSMGTIATVSSIAVGLAGQRGFRSYPWCGNGGRRRYVWR